MNQPAQKGSSTIITFIGLVFFLSSLIAMVSVTTNLDIKTVVSSLAYGEGLKTKNSMLKRTLTKKKEAEKEEKEKKEKEKEKKQSSTKKTSGAIEGCGGSTSTSGCFCTTTNCYWNDSKGNTWGISKDKKTILETVISEKNASESYSQLSVVDNGEKKPLTENLVYELYEKIQKEKDEEAKKSQTDNKPAEVIKITTTPQETSPTATTTTTTTYYTSGEYYECLKNAASSSECKLSTPRLNELENTNSNTTPATTTHTATDAEIKAQNDASISQTTTTQPNTTSATTAQLKTSNENVVPVDSTSETPSENPVYDSCRKLGTVGQCSPLVNPETPKDTTTPELALSQVNYLAKQEIITPQQAVQLNPEYVEVTPTTNQEFVFYTQTSPQWANVKISLPNGEIQQFYKFGCGSTVVANLVTNYIDSKVTPISVYHEYFTDDENGLLGIGEVTNTLQELNFEVIEDRKSFYNYGNSLNAGYMGLMLVSFKNYEGQWVDHYTLATDFTVDGAGVSETILQDPYFGPLSCTQEEDSYSCKSEKGTKIKYKFNSKYLVKYKGK